jgi:MFS family permease
LCDESSTALSGCSSSFQEASGIEAVVLYSPLVFKRADMSSSDRAVLGATVSVGAVKTLSILVATSLSDRLGRRPLLLASTGGVAVAMASLAASLWLGATSACLASVLAFVVAFSVGFGPLVPAYGAEVLPLRLRARGTSVGTAVRRLVCAAVSMMFISLAGAVTMPGCFLLYGGVAAAAFVFVFVFVYTRLPETRGWSLEDMDVLFDK